MRSYARRRDTIVSKPNSERFFLLDNGKPANARGILFALHSICRKLGWKPRGDYQRDRLHDLRHTHIVASLLRAYQHGDEIDRIMLALSTYVGHAKIADTYWYVTGIPELWRSQRLASRTLRKESRNERLALPARPPSSPHWCNASLPIE